MSTGDIRHMRLNSSAHIVLFAVLVVSCVMVSRSEQELFAQQRAGTPQASQNHAHALQSDTPASLRKHRFTHLSVADGLSHSDVRAIVQDRQGFLWFGTWLGGLNRYDGYTFKVYKHDDRDDRSLGSDSIWGLYVDRTGVLWVGTNDGVDRYERDTDSFVHHRRRADDPTSLPGYQATSFAEDKSGTLWVTTSGGLARFDRSSSRFVAYSPAAGSPTKFDTDTRALCFDATGLLWLSTWGGGVSVLDTSTGRSTQYKNNFTDPLSLSNNDVSHIFQDTAGAVWISTQHGLNRFDPKTHKFTRYVHDPINPASLTDDYVQATLEDHEGRFWVATNNGLNVMDRERGTFSRYLHDGSDSSSLSSNVINKRALYADDSGALWIGTRSTGVDRVPGIGDRFTTYRQTSEGANTLSNNVITSLAMGRAGALWIGTEAGLDRFDGQTFAHYLANRDDPGSLGPGAQRLVVEDAHGTIWTGTYGGGLDRLNRRGVKRFRHADGNPNSLGNDNVAGLVADRVGGVWIGVFGAGLDYFDGKRFLHFLPNPSDPASLPDAYVEPVLLDSRGMLWMVSTHAGLVRLDTNTRRFTSYLLDVNRPGSPAVNWTDDIYSEGATIWVASATGLFRFDIGTEKFTSHYSEKDGLPSNKVLGVLGDALGNVWVSTDKGLSRFDPRSQTFRNYDVLDGLQGNVFSARCRARAPDGRLFFGGGNGLSAFYPDKLADNPTPPPVVLTEFELFNKPVKVGEKDSPLQQAIHAASGIVLRHDQSVIRFQFAALNYDSPRKNQYAYKLEGFDRDWQHTDAGRRFGTYTNLDPGHYTFRVKASNNDGVWNEQGVVLHLTILPPWWKTNWFRALCAMVFVALLWVAYQFRVRQLHHEFEMRLEARVGERTRIARELHDTLLQSFHGLLMSFQVVSRLLPGRPGEAKEKLESAIEQAEGAILEGREAVRGLRASTVEKNDLAGAISTLGEELASDSPNSPGPVFRVAVVGVTRDLHPILRDEVYRIAAEALRNAFRHAQARQIEIEIRYGNQEFRLHVRDDGRGLDPAVSVSQRRAGHYGLPGMRERAKIAGGKLTVWSEVGAGTEVELQIPASTAYAKGRRHSWLSEKLARKAEE